MTTASPLPARTWTRDPAASTITVSVKKLGMFTVPATLAVASGTIEIDADHQVTDVDITADAASYASKSAERDAHAIGADFFETGNHPSIRLRTSAVTPSGSGCSSAGTVTVTATTTARSARSMPRRGRRPSPVMTHLSTTSRATRSTP